MGLARLSQGLVVASLIGIGALGAMPMSPAQACGYHTTHSTAKGSFQVPNAPWPNVLGLGSGLFVVGTVAAVLYQKHQKSQANASTSPTSSDILESEISAPAKTLV